jgi:hypothetical protein
VGDRGRADRGGLPEGYSQLDLSPATIINVTWVTLKGVQP